jgi:hypothetical protein
MIPQGGTINEDALQDQEQPSLTYQLDFERGRVTGTIDGLAAVRQAVFKIIQTDRFWHDVYSFDYGHELSNLIGHSPSYVQAEASRMISEALLQDDRVTAVRDIVVETVGDQQTMRFTVVTPYGTFNEEVRRDV